MVAEKHKDANLILKFLQCLSRNVDEWGLKREDLILPNTRLLIRFIMPGNIHANRSLHLLSVYSALVFRNSRVL